MSNAFELALVEQHALARRHYGLRGGLGELTMDQMHIVLATGSFAAGALVMHLLHRFKVMR